MDIQKQIKLLEELFNQLKPIRYSSRDNFDILEGKAKMYVRKFFGDDSHYLEEIEDISYFPMMFTSDSDDSYFAQSFETGVKSLCDLLVVMMEDLKLSTNYESIVETKIVTTKTPINKEQKKRSINPKEIHVLIASPGDVIEERELLLNSLETKFRRSGYEQRSGYRIIVRGWEELATQSGYGQDIINTQILSKVDIVLSVFKHKLGNPTKDMETGHERSKSGTAEELLYAIRNNSIDNTPLGMVYFFSEAPKLSFDSPNFAIAVKSWEELKEFKDDIKDDILYKSYKSEEDLLIISCEDLVKNIEVYFE